MTSEAPVLPPVNMNPKPTAAALAYAESVRAANEAAVGNNAVPSANKKKRCCVKGCSNHTNLQRVPPPPKPVPLGVTKERQITFAKRILKREEYMERLGRKRDDKTKDLRFCNNHRMEEQMFSLNVTIKDKEGVEIESVSVPLEFTVPVGVAAKPALPGRKKRCCVKGCNNHMSLQRVPPLPKPIPAGASKSRQITRAKKVFKRTEFMKRLGYSEADYEKRPDLRFCPNHKMENRNWTFTVSIKNKDGVETEVVESHAQFAVPVQSLLDKKDESSSDADEPSASAPAGAEAVADAVMESGQPSEAAFDPVAPVEKKEYESVLHAEPTDASTSGQPLQSIMM